ncbi:MAG: hypothetical protein NT069_26020 [Planctomycetota bacterium]|nr:hypothetical protein [Planctomycetota bacterium]
MKCTFDGLMEAKSTQPMMKKAFLDQKNLKNKSKGITPEVQIMQVRCPKCSSRWRMRADQLH